MEQTVHSRGSFLKALGRSYKNAMKWKTLVVDIGRSKLWQKRAMVLQNLQRLNQTGV